jgi:hypothetical protein
MAVQTDFTLTPRDLRRPIERLFTLSAGKIAYLERTWPPGSGAPVFTVRGRYASRGWTEWTQGFQYGSALLQFDATGEESFLELGRRLTLERMPPHLTHTGVHDHGFNQLSTYGNLWRLAREGRLSSDASARPVCELALRVSGAVQAARWTALAPGGFIYSFNGPHSLFIDTMRSLRSLAVAHQLGQVLLGERDRRISLLGRLLAHARATATWNVYYGKGRDLWDIRGRTAHESIFDVNDGSYRCPSSQQGYSPFTTWTRGLAWAILGFAEQLEFLRAFPDADLAAAESPAPPEGAEPARALFLRAATATAEFYLAHAFGDGIPIWDTGAPHAHRLAAGADRPADPWNRWEPVDSSAAAIAAQGLIRLGNYLLGQGRRRQGRTCRQAGLTMARTLLAEPYLSTDPRHQGLLLHSVYHRPNGWDRIAPGQAVPNGESSIWGDYHLRELALLIWRETDGECYPVFFAS